MTTNVQTISPLLQIQMQNLELRVETDSKSTFEQELTLFEDEQISVDVNLEINLEYNPDWGRSINGVKVNFLSAYDSRECEDVMLDPAEVRQLEFFLKNNLKIQIS